MIDLPTGSAMSRTVMKDDVVSSVRRLWHFLAPSTIREIRLLLSRCRDLLPGRLRRVSFAIRAVTRRICRNSNPVRLSSPLIGSPIMLRPFSSDLAVAVELFVNGDYALLSELVESPKTILDLGANVGLSIRLLQTWFPSAKILALEPNPESAAVARLNIQFGPCPSAAILLEAAIDSRPGTVHFSIDDQPWSHHTVDQPTTSSITVRSVTMLDCFAMLGTSVIDVCKCDIEGGEAVLFSDCAAWINRVNTLVVETHLPYDVLALEADLRRNGSTLIKRHCVGRGNFSLVFFSRDAEKTP